MFRLYDSTRREICMAAFIGLCLLPTLGVCMGNRPAFALGPRERGGAAEHGVGVAVSVESIAHTVPGVVRYTGLKLTDPETGLALLRCDELEATWTSMTDSQGQIRPAVEIAARNVESAAAAWPRLKEVLCRSLECQNGQPEVEVRATADAWKVHNGGESNLPRGRNGWNRRQSPAQRLSSPNGVQARARQIEDVGADAAAARPARISAGVSLRFGDGLRRRAAVHRGIDPGGAANRPAAESRRGMAGEFGAPPATELGDQVTSFFPLDTPDVFCETSRSICPFLRQSLFLGSCALTWIANWIPRAAILLLCTVLACSAGCRSTSNSSSSNGQNYTGVWSSSSSQPSKPQTPGDFIGLPRQSNLYFQERL